jgi:hypothetical protein
VTRGRAVPSAGLGLLALWRLLHRPPSEWWLDVPLAAFLLGIWTVLRPASAPRAASVAAAVVLAVYVRLQAPLLLGVLAP